MGIAPNAASPFASARNSFLSGPRPVPCTMRGSAWAILPSGVAKGTSCPRRVIASQGTPASVGSKSLLGNGINTGGIRTRNKDMVVILRCYHVCAYFTLGKLAGDGGCQADGIQAGMYTKRHTLEYRLLAWNR
jgi:hypothetical protein